MSKPIISIITGFFNTRDFLAEAVESVLKQDYQEWELLLVDDGSNDGSTEIAKKYAAADNRIIYLEHPDHINKGVSASRQFAFTQSRGEYIALLDADDAWTVQKLSKQHDIMKRNPEIDLLCEASMYWYSWNKEATSEDIVIPVGAPQDRLYEPPELTKILYPLAKGAAPCPSGVMFRRNAIIATGGLDNGFTGDFQSYEDQALFTKFYLHKRVYISSLCNNLYRQRSGSLVFNTHEQMKYRRVRRYFLYWLHAYMTEKNIQDKNVLIRLRRAFSEDRLPLLHKMARKSARGIARLLKMRKK
ncbi:MAG TPA: glycosyltransferase family 2 protein [Chitinophagaceae bacterium]|nr:glycosyltransferase family 2 protein [Chitinophagaceae bacterium]